jgi:enoyl-CoA hydratase/carnithine racemase
VSRLEEYRHRYPNIAIERTDAVLTMRVHSQGGSLKWGALESSVQAQLGNAFFDVGHDPDTRIVIFTGTGDRFCTEGDPAEYPAMNAVSWSRLMHEGQDLLMNLLNIEVPVIGVINGPAAIHAELPALGDVVIAADDAYIQDAAHIPAGVMPGDEVLPRDRLLDRATELAQELASRPVVTMRNTRLLLTQHFKKRLLEELGHGLSLQGLSIYALNEPPGDRRPGS